MLAVMNPSGPVHTVLTVTETSTAGLNSTAHIRTLEDPTIMELSKSLMTLTTLGSGTGKQKNQT